MYTIFVLLEANISSTFSYFTSRFGRSSLLPTKRIIVFFFVFSYASKIHLLTLSNVLELVRSKTTMAPTAPL